MYLRVGECLPLPCLKNSLVVKNTCQNFPSGVYTVLFGFFPDSSGFTYTHVLTSSLIVLVVDAYNFSFISELYKLFVGIFQFGICPFSVLFYLDMYLLIHKVMQYTSVGCNV